MTSSRYGVRKQFEILGLFQGPDLAAPKRPVAETDHDLSLPPADSRLLGGTT